MRSSKTRNPITAKCQSYSGYGQQENPCRRPTREECRQNLAEVVDGWVLVRLAREDILQVEWVSEELASEAWSVFEKFNVDKQWSFTDCVSYVVMRRLGMVDVFAFDHHFNQMGFVRQP